MARQFNGSTDYLVSASALTLSGSSLLTIAFWGFWDAWGGGEDAFMVYGNPVTENGTVAVIGNSSAGGFHTYVQDAAALVDAYVTWPSAAAWHHYVITIDRSLTGADQIAGVWIDGVSQSMSALYPPTDVGTWGDHLLYLMSNFGGLTQNGAGRLAELSLYSGYLFGQSDVDALYNGGAEALANEVSTPTYYWRILGTADPEPATVGGINLTVTGATFAEHPFADSLPIGRHLLPEQYYVQPRAQFPHRRSRRGFRPGSSEGAPQTPIQIRTRLLPDRAPGARRAAAPAYQLRQFTVELYAAQTPIQTQSRLLPDRAPGRPRARRTAYQIDTDLDSLYAPAAPSQEEEIFPTRMLSPNRAPGRARAARPAYRLDPAPPDLFSNALPPGRTLFPDRQIAKERPQYPDRRARRKAFPGATAEALQLDFAELFGGRALLPDHAPGPRRADRTAYLVGDNPARLYAPAAPTEFEELLPARQLLPSQAPGQARAARDAYDLIDNLVDLYAPPTAASSPELFPSLQQLPDRVPPARRRFRTRKFFPGGTQAYQVAEGQGLLPFKVFAKPRAVAKAYQIETFAVDIYATQTSEEVWKSLLPARVFAPRRACRDAYLLAPSLVDLYAAQTPITSQSRLLPNRAPGPRRAAPRAYALEKNDPEFFSPPFVPPSLFPTRMLLGVGL